MLRRAALSVGLLLATTAPSEGFAQRTPAADSIACRAFDARLADYLSKEFSCAVTDIEAKRESIVVRGRLSGEGPFYLCELTPADDVGDAGITRQAVCAARDGSFEATFGRYADQAGSTYDRTLSRWILSRMEANGTLAPVSHARYADRIEPRWQTEPFASASKKGLGDVVADSLMLGDLDELGIANATVNIRITAFMHSRPGAGRIAHTYGGETYYFDRSYIEALDASLSACHDRGIIVAAIILINPEASSADPAIGRLLQHPDYTAPGNYAMPNLTTPQSVGAYAAALDFLAERYTRPDAPRGRIHLWIMHNEVDSGLEWTNMGPGKPVGVYMDAYVKSLRLCHNIVRRYDSHAWVMASHTHAWAVADNAETYASREMLRILNDYGRAEGDFRWGVAFHCYPQNLYEPKTWLDTEALYDEDAPIVTYKNPEVIDRWIRRPEHLYAGQIKRPLWLSENGTNSPSYSDADQQEQAAGLAWGWKKIAALEGIDAHIWHNWCDHEKEYGLRIGLRKFPRDGRLPKTVWSLYRAAGTPAEETAFARMLPVIGIEAWDIIRELPDHSCNP